MLPWSVYEIFSFQQGFGEYERRPLDVLQKALANSAAALTCVDIPRISNRKLASIFSGGGEHQAYCASAAVWLREHHGGFTTNQSRLHYAGGIADVTSANGRTHIECGYTQAGKVLDAITAGQTVIVVPYGYVYQQALCGFAFSRGPTYNNGLVELFNKGALDAAEDKMWGEV